MRIHYLIHVPFENLGAIEQWATTAGYPLSGTHTYRGEQLPAIDQFDFLIIMGGPQSLREINKYPYLLKERDFIRQTIHHKKLVLGICLGAQLIAESLGAKTEASPFKEIGAHTVELTPEGIADPFFAKFPQQFDAMHWHSDMAGAPEDSVLLAKSSGCPRQAFRYRDHVYGLQFHMEMTPELLNHIALNNPDDLLPDTFVQPKEQLLTFDYVPMHHQLFSALEYLATQHHNTKL